MEKKKTKKMTKFFTERRKKGLVLCCMIALLVTVSYLNVTLTNKQNDVENVDTQTESAFFESWQTMQQQNYNEKFSVLDSIIESEDSSEDAKKDAETKKQKLIDRMELEGTLHQILMGRGLPYVGVVLTDNCANIMVFNEKLLSEKERVIIYDVLTLETEFNYESTIIIDAE